MKRYALLMAIALMAFTACEVKIKTSDSKIRNNIQVNATGGVKVDQAFLLDPNGQLIADDNLVKVNEPINLRLVVEGWSAKDGKVSLGASEKLETSDKEVMLDEKDLFANLGEVTEADSKNITLKIVVERVSKLYDYYLVSFRVWDKNGKGEITGSYKFNIKS